VPSIRKITPADYPELLAAVDAGVTQRQLARRYNCAPSLIARHVAKARQAQEFSAVGQEPDVDATADEVTNSLREIMEARIRDPNTSARDLASLANAVTRLKDDGKSASAPPITSLRLGTLILEPGPSSGPEHRYRLLRVRGGIRHVSGPYYDLTAAHALYLLLCALGEELGLTPEALGFTPEDVAAATTPKQ